MFQQARKVKVNKLHCVKTTNTYTDIYRRSWSLDTTASDLDLLRTCMNPTNSLETLPINPTTVAANTPGIVKISPAVAGGRPVGIPNGWRESRFKYLLETECQIDANTYAVTYVIGYTEYYDQSIYGELDPNMKFYINNMVTVYRHIDPVYNRSNTTPSDMYTLITPDHTPNDMLLDKNLVTIRPTDILTDQFVTESYSTSVGNAVTVHNMLGEITPNTPILSSSGNANPLKYFANTVNRYVTAKNDLQDLHSSNPLKSILANAANNVREPLHLDNAFIFELHNITGDFNPTYFTLATLAKIDPSITEDNNHKVYVFRGDDWVSNNYMPSFTNTDVVAETYIPSAESLKATHLASAIPSLMFDYLTHIYSAVFTNDTVGGQDVVNTTNSRSLLPDVQDGKDLYLVKSLEEAIKKQVLPIISDMGRTVYTISLVCDIIGDTVVSISLNHQPAEIYRFPVYASGLYTPVVATRDHKGMMASDFLNIMHEVTDGSNGILTDVF